MEDCEPEQEKVNAVVQELLQGVQATATLTEIEDAETSPWDGCAHRLHGGFVERGGGFASPNKTR